MPVTRRKSKIWTPKSGVSTLGHLAWSMMGQTLCGYGKVLTALNVRQQSILRKSGPFVKPTTSKVATKPGKDKATTFAMSFAANTAKKRSRGRGRLIKGLSPHVALPPVSAPLTTSLPDPAVHPAVIISTDARPQYRQAAHRSLLSSQSESEESLSSPVREKQRMLPPINPGQGDLWDHLSRRHQHLREEAQLPPPGRVQRRQTQGLGRSGAFQRQPVLQPPQEDKPGPAVLFQVRSSQAYTFCHSHIRRPGSHFGSRLRRCFWPLWPKQKAARGAGQVCRQKGEILYLLEY